MRVNHLGHVHALLLLAHVVIDHLDVLLRPPLLRVLRQRDRPLVLLPHVLYEARRVTYQSALDRVNQRARTLRKTVRTTSLLQLLLLF